MGRAIREFKKSTDEMTDSVMNASSTHDEPGATAAGTTGAQARGHPGTQHPA